MGRRGHEKGARRAPFSQCLSGVVAYEFEETGSSEGDGAGAVVDV
jgi:hypothetical protein